MKNFLERVIRKIKWKLRPNRVVPSAPEKRAIIEDNRRKYAPATFVETGTFLGDTVDYFKEKFGSITSIELSEKLAARAQKRFAGYDHIKVIQGDSSIVLPAVLAGINSTVLFWLDGHYSSEFFVNDEYILTARGEKKTPIEKELDVILKAPIRSIILVDDARLFTGKDDYPTIQAIRKRVKRINNSYRIFVKKDIIHIVPNS